MTESDHPVPPTSAEAQPAEIHDPAAARDHIAHHPPRPHSPIVLIHDARRAQSVQLKVADAITKFAGSMMFVYVHIVIFAVWMLFLESSPWETLTLIVSLEAIFLSTFVMIGQNRSSSFQQAKADHDFYEQEQELRGNTEITRAIHHLAQEIYAAEVKRRQLQADPSATATPDDGASAAGH